MAGPGALGFAADRVCALGRLVAGLPRWFAVKKQAIGSRNALESAKTAAAALSRGAHLVGERQWLIGAVEKFNGHEDHVLIA